MSDGCRVCNGSALRPVLSLPGMPASAQSLPDEAGLAHDVAMDLTIGQCEDCGTVQCLGEPVSYYREVIRAVAYSPEMMVFRQQQFAGWIQAHGLAGKSVLEVGCGKGEYLRLLEAAGLRPTGIEYAQASVDHCLREGLRVERMFPEEPGDRVSGAPFDAFACFNFMEHWPDPRASLRMVRNNVVEGGLGLVEVPNFDLILSRGLLTEFIRDHVFYFTSSTLRNLLEISGWEVLDLQPVWHDYILSATVRKRTEIPVKGFRSVMDGLAREIHAFADGQPSVAVWGAGHQALATIALTGLSHKVRYVIDSAPFKQGRFTPATHRPIVPPGRLEEDPVAAVIVMAAAYSDEVVRTLRRCARSDLRIAVLRENRLEVLS